MAYQVTIPKAVQKQLDLLPEQIYKPLIEEIVLLQNNPIPANVIKLNNNRGYRMQNGDYRVLYDIDDQAQIITLRRVGYRREIYREEE